MDRPDLESQLLCGRALRTALGYASAEAFQAAARAGRVPVPLRKIPGRQGWFARAADVATWLRTINQGFDNPDRGSSGQQPSGEDA